MALTRPPSQSAGIPLAVTTAGTIIGVAEHTILLILALYKQNRPRRQQPGARRVTIKWVGAPTRISFLARPWALWGWDEFGRRVAHLARGV